MRARELGRRAAADELKGELDLGAEQLEHPSGALLAVDGEPPEGRPADEDGPGAQGERLQDVGAAPDPAVDEHLDPAVDRLDDLGQRVDRR